MRKAAPGGLALLPVARQGAAMINQTLKLLGACGVGMLAGYILGVLDQWKRECCYCQDRRDFEEREAHG